MTDERSTFETTKARLEDIVSQVRRKDVSLEQSLDMLEEAVRLVNQCNDLIDQTSWKAPATADGDAQDAGEPTPATELEVVEAVAVTDEDGDGVADTIVDVVAVIGEPEGAEPEGIGDDSGAGEE